jgi:hypothetical protein
MPAFEGALRGLRSLLVIDTVRLRTIIMKTRGGSIVTYILIALAVVVVLWLVSVLIAHLDRQSRERLIKRNLNQRRREEEARERGNRPSFMR